MSENLQMVDWYQVNSYGTIIAVGSVQMQHIGDVVPLPGALVRAGIRANPFHNYEVSPGIVAAYTPAELALRSAPVPGRVWSARAMNWVKG